MYNTIDNSSTIIGNVTPVNNSQGFKDDIVSIFDRYAAEGVNITSDFGAICGDANLKNDFINMALESVANTEALSDGAIANEAFYNNYGERLEQLVSNSMLDMARESVMTGYSPITSYAPFMIKKQWVACVWKDVLMAEVTNNPIVKFQMEKRWVKDLNGNRYQIPDVYYDKTTMQTLLNNCTGLKILETPITLPMQAVCLIDPTKNTDTTKKYIEDGLVVKDAANTLTHDIHVWKVTFTDGSNTYDVPCNIKVDVSTGAFVKGQVQYSVMDADGAVTKVLKDEIVGSVDFMTGTVSLFATHGIVTAICLRGKTANRYNHRSLDVERTVEPLTYYMPESGPRLNSAVTIEEAQDAIALGKIDMFADNVDMMGDVLANLQDIDIKMFMETSKETQQSAQSGPFGYKKMYYENTFNAVPLTGTGVMITDWMSQAKEYFERLVEEMKYVINTSRMVMCCVCHPSLVRYLKADVNWVFSDATDVSGLKISYNVGVSNSSNGDRFHIVTSSYMSADEGVMVVPIPTTSEVVTFKHLMYSVIVDRGYRHPLEPLVPNVMSTQRTLTFEVTPLQGCFKIDGRSLSSPTSYAGTFNVTNTVANIAETPVTAPTTPAGD